ncbi:sorting and assembly machinery component 50 homolog [Dreissena polymorpha]|uniref:Bacterial surface antigen (D15) domain-containing protein n=1 Tax=Dreissena polymorpha TaxID=45954 RepID=A0A9D4R916_DREPO|nr:sorting and assembly machinery component 50 homolog [Dreissena polymorpha]KAH3857700.1 hypothetical protein DPMN_100312 [Dreissena polymorpha]
MNGNEEVQTLHLDWETLYSKPAFVQRVLVSGLKRTKDDIITKNVKPLLQAENFGDIVKKAEAVSDRLQQLGIFSRIKIEIDTCKGANANDNGYDVRYVVQESGRLKMGYYTMVGQNDGSLEFNFRSPNVLGRAEEVKLDYIYGTKHTRGFGLSLKKPLNGNPDTWFGARAYREQGDYPWSGYKETDHGAGLDLSFLSLLGNHNLRWEGVWRDLRCLSNLSSFRVREQAGHSLKSSLIHTYVRDTRDDMVLPTRGTLLKMTQEYAGIGGNANFFKHGVEFQANQALPLSSVVQVCLAGGIVRPLRDTTVNITDRYFLGGPLTLRGFNKNGIGPHSDGNALGGDVYCMGGLHLYTPLPFRPGSGGFGELFRSHFFVNAGNCGNVENFSLDQVNKENWKAFQNSLRLSYGLGVVLRLGSLARLELNYVLPVWKQAGDSASPGVQLGVGISFL